MFDSPTELFLDRVLRAHVPIPPLESFRYRSLADMIFPVETAQETDRPALCDLPGFHWVVAKLARFGEQHGLFEN